uniref:Phospholipase A2 group IIA n=1 Tax=Equus asinus TaxID=9793 RepID=A0A9L0JB83_EQUAS
MNIQKEESCRHEDPPAVGGDHGLWPAAGPGPFAGFPENDPVDDRKGSYIQLWLLRLPLWCGRQRIPQGCNRSKRGCGTKLLNYKFSYRGGKIICAKQDFCRSELCQCDKTAASCFARNRKTYSKKYQYYNNKSCRGKTPRC